MSSVTYSRRFGKTGRPLGMRDVLDKVTDTALSGLAVWVAARRAARLARPAEPTAATRDAAQVRRMADRYRQSAPGFASDLYAAADQHELLADR